MIYNYQDIFEDIPDDPENVLMRIPDEILDATGWKPGDILSIKLEDGKLTISKKNG
jgi:hypothetical protein